MEGNANTPAGPPAQKRFKMANGGAKVKCAQSNSCLFYFTGFIGDYFIQFVSRLINIYFSMRKYYQRYPSYCPM